MAGLQRSSAAHPATRFSTWRLTPLHPPRSLAHLGGYSANPANFNADCNIQPPQKFALAFNYLLTQHSVPST
jgi:hypothetical protein